MDVVARYSSLTERGDSHAQPDRDSALRDPRVPRRHTDVPAVRLTGPLLPTLLALVAGCAGEEREVATSGHLDAESELADARRALDRLAMNVPDLARDAVEIVDVPLAAAVEGGGDVAPLVDQATDGVDGAQPSGTIDTGNPLTGAGPVEEVNRVGPRLGFAEGPFWVADEGVLYLSDLGGRVMRRLRPPRAFDVVLLGRTNGIGRLPSGDIVFCDLSSSGRPGLSRLLPGGGRSPLVDRWPGGEGTAAGVFNGPNDLVVSRRGSVFFTDPGDGDGGRLGFTGVFRADPSGSVELVSRSVRAPNGIVLSGDQRTLYVAERTPPRIVAFSLDGEERATGFRSVFVVLDDYADGLAVDDADNVYAAVRQASRIDAFSRTGRRWGALRFPRRPANMSFGDDDRRTLYVAAEESLYRVRLRVPGMP